MGKTGTFTASWRRCDSPTALPPFPTPTPRRSLKDTKEETGKPCPCAHRFNISLRLLRTACQDWWTKDTIGPSADPDAWEIIDGKLFVFMYDTPRSRFMAGDVETEIETGTARWEAWFGEGALVFNTNCFWHCLASDAKDYCTD